VTPQERQLLVQKKVGLIECYVAETDFVTFLADTLEGHSESLSIDEILRAKDFVDRIHSMLNNIEVSDEKYHQNPSDDNVPLPCVTIFISDCYYR